MTPATLVIQRGMDTSAVATLEGKIFLSFKPKVTKLWLTGVIHSTQILNVIGEIVKVGLSCSQITVSSSYQALDRDVLVFSLKAAPGDIRVMIPISCSRCPTSMPSRKAGDTVGGEAEISVYSPVKEGPCKHPSRPQLVTDCSRLVSFSGLSQFRRLL